MKTDDRINFIQNERHSVVCCVIFLNVNTIRLECTELFKSRKRRSKVQCHGHLSMSGPPHEEWMETTSFEQKTSRVRADDKVICVPNCLRTPVQSNLNSTVDKILRATLASKHHAAAVGNVTHSYITFH